MLDYYYLYSVCIKNLTSLSLSLRVSESSILFVFFSMVFLSIDFFFFKNKKNIKKPEDSLSLSKEIFRALSLFAFARLCRLCYPSPLDLDSRISLLIFFIIVLRFLFSLQDCLQPKVFIFFDGFLLKARSVFWYFLNLILLIEGFFFKSSFTKAFFFSFFGFLLLKLQLFLFVKELFKNAFEDLAWFLFVFSLFFRLYNTFRSKFLLPVVKKDGVLEGSDLVSYLLGLKGASHLKVNCFSENSHVVYSNCYKGLFLCKRTFRGLAFVFKRKGLFKGFVFGFRVSNRVGLSSFASGFALAYMLFAFILFRDAGSLSFYECLLTSSKGEYNWHLKVYSFIVEDVKSSAATVAAATKAKQACESSYVNFIKKVESIKSSFFKRCVSLYITGTRVLMEESDCINDREQKREFYVQSLWFKDIQNEKLSKDKHFIIKFFSR